MVSRMTTPIVEETFYLEFVVVTIFQQVNFGLDVVDGICLGLGN